jgi:hypothetical protein
MQVAAPSFPPLRSPFQVGELAHLAEAVLQLDRVVDWAALEREGAVAHGRPEAARQWQEHATDEYRAMLNAWSLYGDLLAIGEPIEVLSAASRVVSDELRHTELCLRVAQAFGGERAPSRSLAPAGLGGAPTALHRVARAMLCSVYVSETASLYILKEARRAQDLPTVRTIIGAILQDEALHSRFGADWLSARWPGLDSDVQRFAAHDLGVVFSQLVGGVPPHLVAAVHTACERTIVPFIEDLGVPAREAWRAAASSEALR